MEVLINHLDWLALSVGAVGSVAWAHNGRGARYASLWWLLSSGLWIAFAWAHGLPALGVRDVLGLGTTIYGSYRWLGSPAQLPRRPIRARRGGCRARRTRTAARAVGRTAGTPAVEAKRGGHGAAVTSVPVSCLRGGTIAPR